MKAYMEKLNQFSGHKICQGNPLNFCGKIFSLSKLIYFAFPTTLLVSIAYEAFYKCKPHHIRMQAFTVSRNQKHKQSKNRQIVQA